MAMNDDNNWLYDTFNGVGRLSAVVRCVECWMHWSGRGAVLGCNLAPHAGTTFIRSTEENVYASRMVLSVQNDLELAENAPATHSLKHGEFSRSRDSCHLLTNFEYKCKEKLSVSSHFALDAMLRY